MIFSFVKQMVGNNTSYSAGVVVITEGPFLPLSQVKWKKPPQTAVDVVVVWTTELAQHVLSLP